MKSWMAVLFCVGEAGLMACLLRTSKKFRGERALSVGILCVCSAAAWTAGYLTAERVESPFECVGLGTALGGVSASMLSDWEDRIIPNRYIGILCAARGLLLAMEMLAGQPWRESLLRSLLGAAGAFALTFVLCAGTRGGLGMGDVKLLAAIGILAGLSAAVSCLLFGVITCALCALPLLARKRLSLRDSLPFAPFLFVGYVITLVLGAV